MNQIREVALSLGSNLGDRYRHIAVMQEKLAAVLKPPVRVSSLMETAPLGVSANQQSFLNRVIAGSYGADLEDLFALSRSIERECGRTQKGMGEARTADIDILLFGDKIIKTPTLRVPHAGIVSRRFLLEALAEIMPAKKHPEHKKTFSDLKENMSKEIRDQYIRFLEKPSAPDLAP